MAKVQTRRSISVSAAAYPQIQAAAHSAGLSVSWLVERLIGDLPPVEPTPEPETCTVCEGPIDENGECRCE